MGEWIHISSQIFFFSSRISYYFCIVPITLFVAVIIFYLTYSYLLHCTEDLLGLGHSSITQCLFSAWVGRPWADKRERGSSSVARHALKNPAVGFPRSLITVMPLPVIPPITASRTLHPGCLLLAWIPHPNYDYLRARVMLNESMNF